MIELKPKEDYNLEKLGREFNDELLNYAFYSKQQEKLGDIRKIIVERALFANDPELVSETQNQDDEDAIIDDSEYIDVPEGIAIPWEEKFEENKNK